MIPPPVILLAALCLGLAAQHLRPRLIFTGVAPAYIAGGCLIAAGFALSAWMVVHFRRAATPVSALRPARQLVVTGPYRYSRNPDYLGQALLYAGIALAVNSLWVLLALVPALMIIRYAVMAREERYLRFRFGAEYEEYSQRVRRWF